MSGAQPAQAVLLDTCAMIWVANAVSISAAAIAAIRYAGSAGGVHVSTASAWEVGMLSRPRPNHPAGPSFVPDAKTWFARFLAGPGVKEARLTPSIAIDAPHLPGGFHADPADRLIVATVRALGMPLVTGDQKILAYAAAGHVRAIAC